MGKAEEDTYSRLVKKYPERINEYMYDDVRNRIDDILCDVSTKYNVSTARVANLIRKSMRED